MSLEDKVTAVIAAAHPKLRERCSESKIISVLEGEGAYDVDGLQALLGVPDSFNVLRDKLDQQGAAPHAFLALLSKATNVGVASLTVGAAPTPPPAPRVKILVVVSNPRNAQLPAACEEAYVVQHAWQGKHGDVVIVGEQAGVTPDRLSELIAEHKPNVLHFIGHVLNDQEGCRLVLLDDEGKYVYVTAEVLSRILGSLASRKFLEVVILSSCESDEPAMALSDFGLYTVCWDSLAADVACALFAQQIHTHIANSHVPSEPLFQTLEAAFELGVLAVNNDAKWIIADPRSSSGAPGTKVNGKSPAGTPLLLRPRLLPDRLVRVPPTLQAKYVRHDVCHPRQYPSCTDQHAVKMLLRYRYAFQFVQAAGHVVGLYGQSGVGTSTLAITLAHNPCVQSIYSDGVFWVRSFRVRVRVKVRARAGVGFGVGLVLVLGLG